MFELLINPKRAEKKPWQMFLVGFVYALASSLMAYFFFGTDPTLSKYTSIFILTFCVIFSLPYVYYTIKTEEKRDLEEQEELSLIKEHSHAIFSFLWLFLGFIVAFSLVYIFLPHGEVLFKAQIETFCYINRPENFNTCIQQYGLVAGDSGLTGNAVMGVGERLLSILANNLKVLMITLIFSLIFGAGAIFILAWSATVIASAIGIFVKSDITQLPFGVLRYMIHGLPEIAAYFIGALAGGILSISLIRLIRQDMDTNKFWEIIEDVLTLIIVAMVILLLAALIEVFITPILF